MARHPTAGPTSTTIATNRSTYVGRSFGRNCITTHDIYRVTSGDFGTKRFQDPNLGDDDAKAMLVELRGTGSQTMAPPSIHPNGQLIEWYAEGEPLIITYNELLKDVERLAAACLLARYWPKRGARHDAALALAGALAHAQWSVDDAVNFIDPIARYKGRSKENEVRDTFKRFAQDKQITGQPTCTAFFSERVWDSIRQWLHLQSPASVVTDWPDPEPLPVTLPSVAALKPSMLPDKLRPSIVDIAERAQAPLDFPAVAVIVALSSALGRRIGIYPKQHDSWLVIPNLWGVIVGKPGSLMNFDEQDR